MLELGLDLRRQISVFYHSASTGSIGISLSAARGVKFANAQSIDVMTVGLLNKPLNMSFHDVHSLKHLIQHYFSTNLSFVAGALNCLMTYI